MSLIKISLLVLCFAAVASVSKAQQQDPILSALGQEWSAAEISHNNAGGDNLPVDETYAQNHIA